MCKAPGRDFYTSLSHEKDNTSRRKHRISNEMCVFASLRSQKEPFGGICDYVPTYFITEQGKLIICCKSSKILRNIQCLHGNILLRYFLLIFD